MCRLLLARLMVAWVVLYVALCILLLPHSRRNTGPLWYLVSPVVRPLIVVWVVARVVWVLYKVVSLLSAALCKRARHRSQVVPRPRLVRVVVCILLVRVPTLFVSVLVWVWWVLKLTQCRGACRCLNWKGRRCRRLWAVSLGQPLSALGAL